MPELHTAPALSLFAAFLFQNVDSQIIPQCHHFKYTLLLSTYEYKSGKYNQSGDFTNHNKIRYLVFVSTMPKLFWELSKNNSVTKLNTPTPPKWKELKSFVFAFHWLIRFTILHSQNFLEPPYPGLAIQILGGQGFDGGIGAWFMTRFKGQKKLV